jgi:predicted amidophosphoribosyltransferase
MRLFIPKWYSPFNQGWKLCNYMTKNAGYDDLSHRLHEFKEHDQTAITAFTGWSIDKLTPVLPELEIDYCIRALGRSELTPSGNKPLDSLAAGISNHFGIEFSPELIAKHRATKHLVGLKKAEREAELDGVFYLNLDVDLNGTSILVVDDIKTSGTTSKFIRKTIIEQFPDVKCYLFVLAETNNEGNTQDMIDMYSKFLV